jgi:hypothetical protein
MNDENAENSKEERRTAACESSFWFVCVVSSSFCHVFVTFRCILRQQDGETAREAILEEVLLL